MASLSVLIYILNSTLLIVHEIDSAYWKEWDLFGLPGGVSGFLLIHIPLVMISLYGTIGVYLDTGFGYIIKLTVALFGVIAFFIHSYFIRAGSSQFKTVTSLGLLYGLLLTSILQLYFVFIR